MSITLRDLTNALVRDLDKSIDDFNIVLNKLDHGEHGMKLSEFDEKALKLIGDTVYKGMVTIRDLVVESPTG